MGKYLRAPEILFEILEKGKDLFVPLKEVAEVRRGFTTGANEFFYLTEEDIKKWGIEKEFWMHEDENGDWIPNYVIKSPRECKSIVVDSGDLKYRVLMIHKDKEELKGTNILKYIEWGEERGFHKRPTCASRKRWYDLGERKGANLLFPERFWDRFVIFDNNIGVMENKNLYGILCDDKDSKRVNMLFNASLGVLFFEIFGRTSLGQGVLDIDVWMTASLPVFNPSLFTTQTQPLKSALEKLSSRPILSVFEEIGANTPEEVSLDKIKPDRRELDEIVMGKILGLTEEEQLEVYRAVVDLVRSRIEKARSVPRQAKRKGVDIGALAEGILREIDIGELKKFPGDYIGDEECREIEVPKGKPEVGSDLHGFFVEIGDTRIECGSQEEAKYIEYAVLNGNAKIMIPTDERAIKKAVGCYGSAYNKLKEDVLVYTKRTIQNNKLREKMEAVVWERITKH